MPRKKKNALEAVQSRYRYRILDMSPEVQRRWKRYLELTEGAERMSKPQWYDFNYPPEKVRKSMVRSRYRHEEID